MQFSPIFCSFPSCRSKCSSQHAVLKLPILFVPSFLTGKEQTHYMITLCVCVCVYIHLDFCHIRPNLMKICVKIIKLVSTPSPYYY
jgi:hypothetical protein